MRIKIKENFKKCFVQKLNQKLFLFRSPQAPLIKGGIKGGIKKWGTYGGQTSDRIMGR